MGGMCLGSVGTFGRQAKRGERKKGWGVWGVWEVWEVCLDTKLENPTHNFAHPAKRLNVALASYLM